MDITCLACYISNSYAVHRRVLYVPPRLRFHVIVSSGVCIYHFREYTTSAEIKYIYKARAIQTKRGREQELEVSKKNKIYSCSIG